MRVFLACVCVGIFPLLSACHRGGSGVAHPSCENAPGVICTQTCGDDVLEPGELCLSERPLIDTSSIPVAITTGDLNHDGLPEIISANYGSSNLSILFNLGGGDFSRPVLIPVEVEPEFVAVSDVNVDGEPDLIVSDAAKIHVLLGHGDGQFQDAISSTFGVSDGVFKVADLNRDGSPDLIGYDEFSGSSVITLLGNGDGSFEAPHALESSSHLGSVDVFDIDNNGKLDIIASGVDGGSLRVWLGAGDGSFFTFFDVLQDDLHPIVIFVTGDFNEDGLVDLILTDTAEDTVRVKLGLGDNSFAPAVEYPTVGQNFFLFSGDANTDGHEDLIVVTSGINLQILLGDGAGAFAAPLEALSVGGPFEQSIGFLAVDDLNGDGLNDIAVQAPDVARLLFGDGSGSFPTRRDRMLGPFAAPWDATSADLNHDNNQDLIMVNFRAGNFGVMLGDGKGSFSYPVHYDVGPNPASFDIADLNEDDNLDVVTAQSDETVSISLGDGSGAFSPPLFLSVDDSFPPEVFGPGLVFGQVFAVDLNGDSHQDIIELSDSTKVLHVFLGDGLGGFADALVSQLEGPIDRSQMKVADLNGDQMLDLAVIEESSEGVRLFFGDGSGAFPAQRLISFGKQPIRMEIGDVDQDGVIDLVFSTLEELCVLSGDSGLLGVPECVSSGVFEFALGDVNNDGLLDVVGQSVVPGALEILLGQGDGSFSEAITLAEARSPFSSVVVSDLNSDQRADVLFLDIILGLPGLFLSGR